MKEMFEGTNEQSVDTAVIQCQNNPCQNDGTCMLTTNQYECNCIEGFSGKHCEDVSITQQLVELRDEIKSIIKLDGKFKRKYARKINNTLKRIASVVDSKREKLEQRKRACFEGGWNWQNFVKTTNGDNYNRDDPCKAADNVFLSLKQWIELFTKNCRNGKHFQKQVDKVEEERDRFFTNFANPVCTWYKTL